MPEKKIALFGGTFDPIHLGHTAVAAAAGEHIGTEKIMFVPARRSPLKAFFPEASDEDRLAMIGLAISGNSGFEVSNYELKKAGPSYTLETIRYFRQQLGSGVLIYWLAGADMLEDLPHWYGVTESERTRLGCRRCCCPRSSHRWCSANTCPCGSSRSVHRR